jgi:hypothetical protein
MLLAVAYQPLPVLRIKRGRADQKPDADIKDLLTVCVEAGLGSTPPPKINERFRAPLSTSDIDQREIQLLCPGARAHKFAERTISNSSRSSRGDHPADHMGLPFKNVCGYILAASLARKQAARKGHEGPIKMSSLIMFFFP